MISSGMATDIVTPYPLSPLEEKVIKLQDDLRRMTADRSFWQKHFEERENQIKELEEYVNKCAVNMDEETFQRLVEIFDLKPTREYDVQVTVTFVGTVTVPVNYVMANLDQDLDARLEFSEDGTRYFMEDKMEINWHEN